MDYNYYPSQPVHPPPPVANQQVGPQLQQQPPHGGQMIHAPMPPQNIRQAMPPCPPSHQQQQMQPIQQQQPHQQQHIGHPQQMHPQQQAQQNQQQHPSYQIQPTHPHGPPPVPHSGSPHPQQPQQQQQQQQQQHHHNHQPTISGPPPQQQIQHHMHPQSPHHHSGPPPMHMQQQPQQQMNQMVRPPPGPSVINHPQPGLQHQQHPHHQQNFFAGGPIPQSNMHQYQQNQHHPNHQPHHQQPIMMHHGPPPPTPHHLHMQGQQQPQQQGVGRTSPYYASILQTEFRVIELNRRLQCRPITRHPVSPLPNNPYDESLWWEKFASDFFEDDATLTLRSSQDDKTVEYTIGRTLIPRFFRTYFEGGVTDLSINLRNPREACLHPQMITLDCDQAFIVTNNIFKHPAIPTNHSVVVHTEGHLILEFVNNNFDVLSIKTWKFYTKSCREYIDRSMTAMGLSNALLVEPVTRQQGLTKSTISYLKMCLIMEPMQDLMLQHKQTKLDPRSCLKKLLFEKYKFRSGDDNRIITSKRRKRKPSAAPTITGAPNPLTANSITNKKTKSNINNSIGSNSGLNNNNINMMSPSGPPSFSLASQDVMVVGEPSMMGGDFGDDNERMITRLENTQYDPSASTPSNVEESDSMNTTTGADHCSSNNNVDLNIEYQNLSPSLLQQQPLHQQQQEEVPIMSQQEHTDQPSPLKQPENIEQQQQQQQTIQMNIQDQQIQEETPTTNQDQISQINLIEQTEDVNQTSEEHEQQQQQKLQEITTVDQQVQQNSSEENHTNDVTQDNYNIKVEQQEEEQELQQEQQQTQQINDDNEKSKIHLIVEPSSESNMMLGVNSIEQMENHTNSIQPLNDESNSNSQLTCSTAPATSAIEQQQPVA